MREECGCLDYEEYEENEDGDGVCVCGHVEDEHKDGFFRTCIYNTEED